MLYSAEEVRSRYYTNTLWLGPHHGITRPRLAHHGCWESNCYPTVTCCCGLPRDYSDCSVLYISLSVLCFVGGCTCNSYSVCRVCHPERTVQCVDLRLLQQRKRIMYDCIKYVYTYAGRYNHTQTSLTHTLHNTANICIL